MEERGEEKGRIGGGRGGERREGERGRGGRRVRGGGEREGKVWFNCYIGIIIVKNYAHTYYVYIIL